MSISGGTLDLVAIENTIYDWIYNSLKDRLDENQVIWRNQSQPLPPRPCVTMKWTYGPAPVARDGNILPASNTVGVQQEATLSIQVFGNTQTHKSIAHQMALDLNSSLLKRDVRLALNQGGVSVYQVGRPQNMTALEESRYEERAGFELSLGMVQNVVDHPGEIKTVNLEKTVDEDTTNQQINLP